MKILITGDKGFVGHNIRKYYEEKYPNISITGYDIKYEPIEDVRLIFSPNYDKYVNTYDIVFHCAAIVGGRETIEYEPLKVATDLAIDSDMFNWAVRTKQPRVVYFSSSAAYPIKLQTGTRQQRLAEFDIDLNNIQTPDMSYGWTKLTGEYLAQFARKEGVKVHIVRPFSGYGPDQDEIYPFPMFIKRAVEKQDPFIVWGSGNQVRDFIHIRDIIEAIDIMIQYEIMGPINIGTGIPTLMYTLASMVCKLAGYQPRIYCDETKPEGVKFRCANTLKLRSFYDPKITLDQGILEALKLKGIK